MASSVDNLICFIIYAVTVVIFLPILMLLLPYVLCTLVISIIPLAIVGIVDLALFAFSGLRSIKSFIVNKNHLINRDGIYREAAVAATTTVELSIKYRHKSLLASVMRELLKTTKKNHSLHIVNAVLVSLEIIIWPFSIIHIAYMTQQSALCLLTSNSKCIELTLMKEGTSVGKIDVSTCEKAHTMFTVELPNGNTHKITDLQFHNNAIDYLFLSKAHYMDNDTAKEIKIRDRLAKLSEQRGIVQALKTQSAADIIAFEQTLLNDMSGYIGTFCIKRYSDNSSCSRDRR